MRRSDAIKLVQKKLTILKKEDPSIGSPESMDNDELTDLIRTYDLHDDPDVEVTGSKDDGQDDDED
jgi:hypothetical protein